jgi:peptidoglycan hydrolase CwlO-like protein
MSKSYQQAKIQILEHSLSKAAKDRDEYKHQLNAANKEIKILKKKILDIRKITK